MSGQSEKRDDGHGTRSRETAKEYDYLLAQVGEAMDSKLCVSGRAGVAMGHESLPGLHRRERRGRRGRNSWS